MKSLFNKYIWLQFILSVLLLFAGALIIAFSIKDFETIKNGGEPIIITKGLNIIFAIILFLFGLFSIVAYSQLWPHLRLNQTKSSQTALFMVPLVLHQVSSYAQIDLKSQTIQFTYQQSSLSLSVRLKSSKQSYCLLKKPVSWLF